MYTEAIGGTYTPVIEQQPWVPTPETSTQWSAETRQAHLESLPHLGLNEYQHAALIDEIVAIGLPVNNYTSLQRSPNTNETENWLGSWGSQRGTDNYGQFTLYEHLDKFIPEMRLSTVSHEGFHGATPLDPQNEHLYGGEAERSKVEDHVWAVTAQAVATGIHLNGYHKHLMEEQAIGKINEATLAEETWAIMSEMALTDRNGLKIVEDRQRRATEDINRIRSNDGQPRVEFIDLISEDDSVDAKGADEALVQLIDGVSSLADLRDHAHQLKSRLYMPENLGTVIERERLMGHVYIYPDYVAMASLVTYFDDINRYLKSFDEDDDEDKDKDKTAS